MMKGGESPGTRAASVVYIEIDISINGSIDYFIITYTLNVARVPSYSEPTFL